MFIAHPGLVADILPFACEIKIGSPNEIIDPNSIAQAGVAGYYIGQQTGIFYVIIRVTVFISHSHNPFELRFTRKRNPKTQQCFPYIHPTFFGFWFLEVLFSHGGVGAIDVFLGVFSCFMSAAETWQGCRQHEFPGCRGHAVLAANLRAAWDEESVLQAAWQYVSREGVQGGRSTEVMFLEGCLSRVPVRCTQWRCKDFAVGAACCTQWRCEDVAVTAPVPLS